MNSDAVCTDTCPVITGVTCSKCITCLFHLNWLCFHGYLMSHSQGIHELDGWTDVNIVKLFLYRGGVTFL